MNSNIAIRGKLNYKGCIHSTGLYYS
jgi:hypothetical protein